MKYYKEYEPFFGDIVGDRKKVDNTIYSFDIETTSYIKLDGKIMQANKYLELSKDEQERADFKSCMYIWMFSINDVVYYGRTWDDFKSFLIKLDFYNLISIVLIFLFYKYLVFSYDSYTINIFSILIDVFKLMLIICF